MWDWLERVFGSGFMPHGHCYLWTPSMVWAQVSSNFFIGLAYASIASTLGALVRRIRNIPFAWAYVAFGIFILSCGLTHWFDVITVWHPIYWFDAGVRIVTALASVATAVLILPLVPKAVALAETAKLSQERGAELALAHAELEKLNAQLAAREQSALNRAMSTEVQFRELIDNLPDLAWTAQADGRVDFYNRRWFEYTGTPMDKLEGWGWKQLVEPGELPRVVEGWDRALAAGEPAEMEFPLLGADGRYRWFLARVRPLRGPDGKIVRWFGSNTDIDDTRRIREELAHTVGLERASRHAAESATRAKDEFLATVSHELRTPLNAILGWARMVASGQVAGDRIQRAVETIERNALAQVQLVEDLLDISRIISGKMRLDVQKVDLQHVIAAAVESLRPAITSKEIRLQVVCDPLATAVVGDGARLQQVLWNVIGNAVKFSPKAGRVVVSVARVNSHVEIAVTDWGKGIAASFLPHVFDHFRQADGSTTRGHGGLGLGLAIAKHIVELHGGRITASSAGEGQGATFLIALPRGGVTASARPPAHHPSAPVAVPVETSEELRGVRVLVLDDEEDARHLVKDILESSGAVVSLAATAEEALDDIRRITPDVVVADIGMPDRDGYEFIAEARRLPSMKKIPAAALTAFARAEDRRRALTAGFQMHVVKPVEPGELIAVVANLVRIRRAML